MIVVKEAKQHIQNGATFALMKHSKNSRLDIYWIKYPWSDGFEIPMRTGRYLEKQGIKPAIWPYDP